MNRPNKIIIHCSDTRTDQDFDIEDIRKWHTSPPRNWSDVGYHYYIKLNGKVQKGRGLSRSGAHCPPHNSSSIGICFEGGKNPDGSSWDSPTIDQINSFKELHSDLNDKFSILPIYGHYQFSNKSCPNFDPCILE